MLKYILNFMDLVREDRKNGFSLSLLFALLGREKKNLVSGQH